MIWRIPGMTPGQLVKAVAIALDVPEETVTQHDRNLVVAGLRTKGGRGPSSPDVTTMDAARLLIAILASSRTKDSVDVVHRYEQVRLTRPFNELIFKTFPEDFKDYKEPSEPSIAALPRDHNIIEAVAALIEAANAPMTNKDEYLARFGPLTVRCSTPRWAKIRREDKRQEYFSYADERSYSKTSPGWFDPNALFDVPYRRFAIMYGMDQTRHIYGASLILIAQAFRENGLRFKNAREALNAWFGLSDRLFGEKPAKSARRKVAG
jgi:hypothetical protein